MSVEVSNMARCSSKSDELRNINSIGCRAGNITIYKRETDNSKIKIVTFIINFGKTISLEMNKWKSKNEARYEGHPINSGNFLIYSEKQLKDIWIQSHLKHSIQ